MNRDFAKLFSHLATLAKRLKTAVQWSPLKRATFNRATRIIGPILHGPDFSLSKTVRIIGPIVRLKGPLFQVQNEDFCTLLSLFV